ncbi:MAG: neutral/alkaline non-lysosomal ceramidase N-terminal domain-containing protein [Planctomycetaceae bacterium]
MTNRFSRVVMVAMALAAFCFCAGADDWSAGVGRQVITPTESMWMSGYAARDRPSQGTLHDLWAKALVLQDDSGRQLVLVTLDLVGIGRDLSTAICDSLQKKHQLQRSQIALCVSHTHTGPVVGHNLISMYSLNAHQKQQVSDYTQFLTQKILAAVEQAMAARKTVSVSFATGSLDFAVNRRNNREADVPALREAGELKGPVDHSLPLLKVADSAGEPLAIVFGYACHATVLSSYEWSGDWPGFAALEIERRHPTATAFFVAGCGADQNPLPRRTVELAQHYGQLTADAVDAALPGVSPLPSVATSAYREIELQLASLPTKDELQQQAVSDNPYVVSRAKSLLQTWEADGQLAPTYPYPVQKWNLGNQLNMTLLGGEVVVDYSLRIKDSHPDQTIWVAGYSNDVMAYIPSLRVLREGGYEGATSMIYYGLPTVWSEQVEEHICRTVDILLE